MNRWLARFWKRRPASAAKAGGGVYRTPGAPPAPRWAFGLEQFRRLGMTAEELTRALQRLNARKPRDPW